MCKNGESVDHLLLHAISLGFLVPLGCVVGYSSKGI
jgi:hypothetical protein